MEENTYNKTEKSAFFNMILRPINMVLALIYTPLLLKYLGDENYGIWSTILSIISWVNYFDVGIGHGLRNVLTENLTQKDVEKARKSISTAYVILTVISSVIFIILVVATFTVDWSFIFSTAKDLKSILFITFLFICINFVLALSNSVLYALEKSELVSLRNCYVQIINIIGIILLIRFSESNLVYVSFLFGGSTLVIYIYNTIKICRMDNYLIPSKKYFDKASISGICSVGSKFFIIQLMCMLMFTVDNILISHYFGPETVTPFSIVDKVFNTGYSVWAAFLLPYWSATTAALSRNDINWIEASIKKTAKVLGLFFMGFIVIAIIFKPAVRIWLQKDLYYQPGIIWLMCIFYIIYSILAVESQFINGIGRINVQLVSYIILGLSNIPLSIILGVYCGLGPFGIRLATTVLIFINIIVLGTNLNYILKELKNEKTI